MILSRRKKLMLNTGAAMLYQIITLVCGFVLPRFVVPYFGSATNGLVSSITQFLTIITLCECGIGAVVQSALYKPLADHDNESISGIVISSRRFFRRIMCILAVYVAVLMVIYPVFLGNEYDYGFLYIGSLVVILALSNIAQYYLFVSYRLLLNADQASYVQLSAHSIALILNTVATIVLIKLGAGIHVVKFVSAVVFFIQPVIIKLYVDRHYKLNMKLKLCDEPIKQKWSGFAQHVSTIVIANTGTVGLTLLSTLENVSIYSVYYLIVHGIRQIIITLNTGVQAMLGNMYAKGETETLNKSYACTELIFHFVVTLLFTITGIMIIPFLTIYTKGFTDAEYIIPVFGLVMTISQAVYCIRIPYEMMIKVAGHYKQTQLSSFIEAGISIVLTVVLIIKFGLVGAAIGMTVAMAYRTVYLSWYLSRNILNRHIGHFLLHILVDCISISIMILATSIFDLTVDNYIEWVLKAILVAVVCAIISFVVNVAFYRKLLVDAMKQFMRKKRKA